MHLLDKTGAKLVVSYAHDVFGIDSELYPGLPLAIGSSSVRPIEMLRAYSVFMTHGDRIEPYPITKIVGPEGESIKEFEVRKYPGVLPAGVCAIMDDLMRSVVTSGTGTEALPVPNAKGKTGTTNDAHDAWFCGYTDGIVGVGWVGNEQKDKRGVYVPVAMAGSVFGGTVTAKIWARIMGEMHDKYAKPVQVDPERNFAVATQSVKPEPSTDSPVKVKVTSDPVNSPPPDMVPDPGMEPAPTTDGGDPHNTPPDSGPTQEEIDAQRKADQAARDAARARQDAQRTKRQDDLVQVEICADSGLRATPYCPETVTRTYHRGEAPTKYCRIHGTGR
jgi:penicillin-binding protein 1A